jgi:hypothetical protein
VKASDLIAQANRLAKASQLKPRQVDLKRAISAAYYAMFHALAQECADTVAGTGPRRSEAAWLQVYRALEHGVVKNACEQAGTRGFPPEIVKFAEAFLIMQEKRHAADYDPQSAYTRPEVIALVADAAQAITSLRSAARPDRRAFVALVLLRQRR